VEPKVLAGAGRFRAGFPGLFRGGSPFFFGRGIGFRLWPSLWGLGLVLDSLPAFQFRFSFGLRLGRLGFGPLVFGLGAVLERDNGETAPPSPHPPPTSPPLLWVE